MTRLLPHWRTFIWASYVVLLLTLTHLPPRDIDKIPIHIWDKLAHVIAYGGLGFLSAVAFSGARDWRRPQRVALWLAALLLLAATDEWTQPWFERTCDLRDWCADFIGLALGLIAARLTGYFMPGVCSPLP